MDDDEPARKSDGGNLSGSRGRERTRPGMRNFHDLGFRLFINVHQDFQALLDEINKQIILEIYAKS